MDAELVNYIKEKYPMIKAAVATCWEEGPKAYWNANNSWYTIFDGGPWNPWIPSKRNIHCPASDEEDDIGIVAIPHISRDLMAVFDGPGSYYGTHPQNILRGMVYEDHEIPYFKNIVDQYRAMAKYNRGYSYNMMYVGPGWMSKGGRWEADYDILLKSYKDGMAYYGQLKKDGQAMDVTMSEFADIYRADRPYTRPECTLWKDILYGSRRQQFWYADPWMRFCLDMNQGGAMIDLRPYAAKLVRPCGVGTKHHPGRLLSVPGAVALPGRVLYALCRRRGGQELPGSATTARRWTCAPAGRWHLVGGRRYPHRDTRPGGDRIRDASRSASQSIFRMTEGTGEIEIIRRIIDTTDPEAEIAIDEYITACYGTTEYPEDLTGVSLTLKGTVRHTKSIEYAYQCREAQWRTSRRPRRSCRRWIPACACAPTRTTRTGISARGLHFRPCTRSASRRSSKAPENCTHGSRSKRQVELSLPALPDAGDRHGHAL